MDWSAHPVITQVRAALFETDPPESCAELATRTGLSRALVDAVFRAQIGQAVPPTPCLKCAGTGASSGDPCRACRATGISAA